MKILRHSQITRICSLYQGATNYSLEKLPTTKVKLTWKSRYPRILKWFPLLTLDTKKINKQHNNDNKIPVHSTDIYQL